MQLDSVAERKGGGKGDVRVNWRKEKPKAGRSVDERRSRATAILARRQRSATSEPKSAATKNPSNGQRSGAAGLTVCGLKG